MIWALRGVSLSVEAGQMLGVIGGNGSGKSTLLRCVNQVLKPVRGEVLIEGRVSSLMDLVAGMDRDLTGYESLTINGVLLGLPRRRIMAYYDQIVTFSGLGPEVLSQALRKYSTGMILRQAIALVLHSGAEVMVIDEILAAADAAFQQTCLKRIATLKADGCAVVMVSHNLDLVADHADRVAVLKKGELDFLGSTAEGVDHYGRGAQDLAPRGEILPRLRL